MDKAKNKKRNLILLSILGLVLFFGTWELLVHVGVISERNLCAPSTAVQTFLYKLTNTKPDGATLFAHFFSSIKLSLAGFVLAVVIGIPLGLFMGYYKGMDSFFTPLFEVVRPIPPIAWIPMIIIWFGIGETAKIVIVFIGAFTSIVLNTSAGIRAIDPLLISAGKVLGANRRQLLVDVAMPATIPAILAGIRTALSSGWMCVVAAEMIAARQGVGFLIVRGQEIGDTALIVVCMLAIGIVSALLSLFLTKMEGVLCPWQFSKTQ